MLLISLLVSLVIFAPYPFPVKEKILTEISPDGNKKVIAYWRGSGLIGYLSEDNPWVYIIIEDIRVHSMRKYYIWADTPCDGVNRLSDKISWKIAACNE